jgi:hypothetical protein
LFTAAYVDEEISIVERKKGKEFFFFFSRKTGMKME